MPESSSIEPLLALFAPGTALFKRQAAQFAAREAARVAEAAAEQARIRAAYAAAREAGSRAFRAGAKPFNEGVLARAIIDRVQSAGSHNALSGLSDALWQGARNPLYEIRHARFLNNPASVAKEITSPRQIRRLFGLSPKPEDLALAGVIEAVLVANARRQNPPNGAIWDNLLPPSILPRWGDEPPR